MASEIETLKKIVQDLAAKVRNDRKIIMATQAFTTTLADNLDVLEESLVASMSALETRVLAAASDTKRILGNVGRAAYDEDH